MFIFTLLLKRSPSLGSLETDVLFYSYVTAWKDELISVLMETKRIAYCIITRITNLGIHILYVSLDHKTSLKCQLFEIEIST